MTRCSAPRTDKAGAHGTGQCPVPRRSEQGAWVKEQKVADGKVVAYQVILQVTFVLDD